MDRRRRAGHARRLRDRLSDLRGFTRDVMRQMETDLGTKFDWVAVDHNNTGHPP